MDSDGNEEIDFDEFSAWWQGRSGAAAGASGGGGASPSALRGKFLAAHSKVMDATLAGTGSKLLTGTVKLATRSVKDVLLSASHHELRQLFDKIDVPTPYNLGVQLFLPLNVWLPLPPSLLSLNSLSLSLSLSLTLSLIPSCFWGSRAGGWQRLLGQDRSGGSLCRDGPRHRSLRDGRSE